MEADHVIKRLRELAPSALLGEQNFFVGWGLHRCSDHHISIIIRIIISIAIVIIIMRGSTGLCPKDSRLDHDLIDKQESPM